MARGYRSITNWLMSAKWDARQRASRYSAPTHILGKGWHQPYDQVVTDATTGTERKEKRYIHIPGFDKSASASAIKVSDVLNEEWPVKYTFTPSARRLNTPLSWRTRLNKNVNKPPMISEVKANPKKGIMLVTFSSNGAQVAYDHVPREVIAELMHAAENDQDGATLGVMFWDIVRYRGSVKGSKYPWWYAQKGTTASQRIESNMSEEQKDYFIKKTQELLDITSDPSWPVGEDPDKASSLRYLYFTKLNEAYDADDYRTMGTIYQKALKEGFI
jgi:hypothetical protein